MGEMITEGWYVPQKKPKRGRSFPRWVLRVTDTDVYYGKGDRNHYFCKLKTFRGWLLRTGATRQVNER